MNVDNFLFLIGLNLVKHLIHTFKRALSILDRFSQIFPCSFFAFYKPAGYGLVNDSNEWIRKMYLMTEWSIQHERDRLSAARNARTSMKHDIEKAGSLDSNLKKRSVALHIKPLWSRMH